jgi:hypothetical protein
MSVLHILAPLLFAGVMAVLALGFVRRRRDQLAPPGQGVTVGADGVTVVPILAAEIRGGMLGGRARNSLGPKLSLDPQGLSFKVLRQDRWTYDQLTRVDVAKSLLGPMLHVQTGRAKLDVTVRDLAVACQVLAALPRTVPLTARAVTLRDTGAI